MGTWHYLHQASGTVNPLSPGFGSGVASTPMACSGMIWGGGVGVSHSPALDLHPRDTDTLVGPRVALHNTHGQQSPQGGGLTLHGKPDSVLTTPGTSNPRLGPHHVEELLQQPAGRGAMALQNLEQVRVADALLKHLLGRRKGAHRWAPRANPKPMEIPEEGASFRAPPPGSASGSQCWRGQELTDGCGGKGPLGRL